MAKGFLRGMVQGGVVSLVLASVASVIAHGPVAPNVSVLAPEGVVGAPPVTVSELDSGAGRDRVPVTGQEAPKTPLPWPDTLESVSQADTRPSAQPEVGQVTAPTSDAPETGLAGSMPSPDAPVLAVPPSDAPRTPANEPTPRVSTEPAPLPVPRPEPTVAVSVSANQPDQPLAPDTGEYAADPGAGVSAAPAVPAGPQDVVVAGQVEIAPESQTAVTPPKAEVAAPHAPALAPADLATGAEISVAVPDRDMTAPDAEVPDAVPSPVGPDSPELEAGQIGDVGLTPGVPAPSEPTQIRTGDTPAPGTPAGTLGDIARGVTVNRLPSLVAGETATNSDSSAEAPAAADAEAGALLPDDLPPVRQFAEPFENPENKPLMAIVLMDMGGDLNGAPIGIAALGSFPYPVSFAVDASLPDADVRMRTYREQGFEVLAMLDLPDNATARDAEASVAAAFAAVPDAVGLLEGIGNGIQSSRDASDQVTAILAQTGHGLVTQNQGLNTVQKLALKAGVPAAAVFRDFDDKEQTPTVIKRFLDQAAFRAGQEGSVIMLGRVRPDTISALLLWGLQDRAEKVALCPVSAVLLSQ